MHRAAQSSMASSPSRAVPRERRAFDRMPPEVRPLSLLGNILWLLFGGLIAGIGYILGGVLLCLTLVGIPFGIQQVKLGFAIFAPAS